MPTPNNQIIDNIIHCQADIMRINSKQLSYEDVKKISAIGMHLFKLRVAISYRPIEKKDIELIDESIDTVNFYLDNLTHEQASLNQVYRRLTSIKGRMEKELKS